MLLKFRSWGWDVLNFRLVKVCSSSRSLNLLFLKFKSRGVSELLNFKRSCWNLMKASLTFSLIDFQICWISKGVANIWSKCCWNSEVEVEMFGISNLSRSAAASNRWTSYFWTLRVVELQNCWISKGAAKICSKCYGNSAKLRLICFEFPTFQGLQQLALVELPIYAV